MMDSSNLQEGEGGGDSVEEVITLGDSPESPEMVEDVENTSSAVITIDDTPESPPGAGEPTDIQFLGSSKDLGMGGSDDYSPMKVRVESDDQLDGGAGICFILDRGGVLRNPLYDPQKLGHEGTAGNGPSHLPHSSSDDSVIPVYDVVSKGVITIGGDSEEEEEQPGSICKKMQKAKSAQKCFNCDGEHMISDCPIPKDSRRIAANIRAFRAKNNNAGKNCRYHEDNDQKFDHLKPGELSESLREALGLNAKQLAMHIYNMRIYGYPPGWKQHALQQTSKLKLYKGTIVLGDSPSDKLNTNRVYDYPGFNCPAPHGFIEESRRLDKPSYTSKYSRDKLIFEFTEEMNELRSRQLMRDEMGNYRQPKRKGDSLLESTLEAQASKRMCLSSNRRSSEEEQFHGSGSRSSRNDRNVPSSSRGLGSNWVDGYGRKVDMGNVHSRPRSNSNVWNQSDAQHSSSQHRYNTHDQPSTSSRCESNRSPFDNDRRYSSGRSNYNDDYHSSSGDRKRRYSNSSQEEKSYHEREDNRHKRRHVNDHRQDKRDKHWKKDNINMDRTPKWNERPLSPSESDRHGSDHRTKSSRKHGDGKHREESQHRRRSPSLLKHHSIPSETAKKSEAEIIILSPPLTPVFLTSPESPTEDETGKDAEHLYKGKFIVNPECPKSGKEKPCSSSIMKSESEESDVRVIAAETKLSFKLISNVRHAVIKTSVECIQIDDCEDDDDDEMRLTIVEDPSELDSEGMKPEGDTVDGVLKNASNSDIETTVEDNFKNASNSDIETKQLETVEDNFKNANPVSVIVEKTAEVVEIDIEMKDLEKMVDTVNTNTDLISDSLQNDKNIVTDDKDASEIRNVEETQLDQNDDKALKLPDVFIYKNCFQELPSLDKFAVGMHDLLLHETNEDHTGRFDRVLSILQKKKNDKALPNKYLG